LESYHAGLRRRIKVSHPNLFSFLSHLSKATIDYMTDKTRMDNGLRIRRPKKKLNIMNEARIKTCLRKFDSGSYTRLQFLHAVSHSLGAHTDALHVRSESQDSDDHDDQYPSPNASTDASASTTTTQASADSTRHAAVNDLCAVCLLSPRVGVALVPCGHSRFCLTCAETVTAIGHGCPLCRSQIDMVMRLF
jgi:hypothetical protein